MADARTLQDDGSGQKGSTAVPSQKTKLHYRAASSNGAWSQVANLTDVTGFNGSASMADVTRLDSDCKEKRPGLQDWGQVSIALHINFKEESHKALLDAKRAGMSLDFKLTLSDKTTIEFTAYVKDFPVSAKVDQYVSGTVNLDITGDVIVTPVPEPKK
ncbi:phage tail tube protein [Caballeronia sp. LZ035]|uniref:phage tail tube protein n=1 Tax=Caballeronia sp. LZ035 TaxID=3038568 RepID=UPI00286436C1|nr:phage tail tube protein [Caballeronia sp. LZ035]MDR5756501.1 phage tail tube protein [Caballeronia sp. LZ035]